MKVTPSAMKITLDRGRDVATDGTDLDLAPAQHLAATWSSPVPDKCEHQKRESHARRE